MKFTCRLFLASVVSFMIAAGISCSTVLAGSATPPSAPLQEEMHCVSASQMMEEENLLAILWVQRSAEFRGLSYQAYNMAAMEVDKVLAQRREKEKALRKAKTKDNTSAQPEPLRPPAVVLDIDDTILCHAPFEVYFIEHPEATSNTGVWEQWIAQNKDLLPGAKEFLNYARSRGIQIFYVTGRGPQDRAATISLFHKTGLPFPDETHLLMNDGSGSKMKHFAKLSRRYDIICYLGDNAGDFPLDANRYKNAPVYKKETAGELSGNTTAMNENTAAKPKTVMPLDTAAMMKHDANKTRNAIIDASRKSFGTRFILLPNPMYGDWENNLAQKYRKLPAEQRIALRKAALKCFAYKEK